MTRISKINHEFVEFIPEELAEGIIYISLVYSTAAHKCCCGCGNKVVTPFSPTDWKLIFDGVSISLYPSIGNWSFKCKSHYWIREGRVTWSRKWSQKEIEDVREYDRTAKERYYDSKNHLKDNQSGNDFWHKIKKWWL